MTGRTYSSSAMAFPGHTDYACSVQRFKDSHVSARSIVYAVALVLAIAAGYVWGSL